MWIRLMGDLLDSNHMENADPGGKNHQIFAKKCKKLNKKSNIFHENFVLKNLFYSLDKTRMRLGMEADANPNVCGTTLPLMVNSW